VFLSKDEDDWKGNQKNVWIRCGGSLHQHQDQAAQTSYQQRESLAPGIGTFVRGRWG